MRQVGSEFVVTISNFFSSLGPLGQWWYLAFQMMLFYSLVVLSGISFLPANHKISQGIRKVNSDRTFAILIFGFVLISRIPSAIYGYQNPDEGVWIACTKALAQEPRLWVVADTATSGPIVLIPLLLLKLANFPVDFGSIKLAAGVIMGLILVTTYFAYCNFFGKAIARLMILPAALALSMTTFWDFFTYNGEHMPILILSIALYLLSIILRNKEQKFHYFLWSGVLMGTMPFAKLQSVPLALLIVGVCYMLLIIRKYTSKQIIYFTLSGLSPALFFLIWLSIGDGLINFWNSYILFNLSYAVSELPSTVTLWDKLALAWHLLFDSNDFTFYFQMSFAIVLFAGLTIHLQKFTKPTVETIILLFTLLYFFVSLFCIGQPYRTFTHYAYFAYFTVNLMAASFMFQLLKRKLIDSENLKFRQTIPAYAILFVTVLYFHQRFTFHPGYVIYAEDRKKGYSYMPEVIKTINDHSTSGDYIVIWGWSNTFYADTDLIMGTRYTDTSGIINEGPFQKYFLSAYLSDLAKNKPKIFLDAITPHAAKFFYRKDFGFENFPDVKQYIDLHYNFVAEIEGYRIFVRNDGGR